MDNTNRNQYSSCSNNYRVDGAMNANTGGQGPPLIMRTSLAAVIRINYSFQALLYVPPLQSMSPRLINSLLPDFFAERASVGKGGQEGGRDDGQ